MKAERWQQINDLFQSATERPPEERAAFLDEACHGDEGLCREVESLIASYEQAETFIESPAFEAAPEFLTNEDRSGALVGESIGHYRPDPALGPDRHPHPRVRGGSVSGRRHQCRVPP